MGSSARCCADIVPCDGLEVTSISIQDYHYTKSFCAFCAKQNLRVHFSVLSPNKAEPYIPFDSYHVRKARRDGTSS